MFTRPLTIRPATEADLPAVFRLDAEAFSVAGTAEDPAIIRARLRVFPDGFFVAEYDGLRAAYASTEAWLELRTPGLDEDPAKTHHPDGRILCVTAMAVRSDLQRQGIGTAMTRHVIQFARSRACTHVVLETTRAVGFYERLGFVRTSERLERGARLVIMALRV